MDSTQEPQQTLPVADSDPTARGRRLWLWLLGAPSLLVMVATLAAGLYFSKEVEGRLAGAIAAADRDDPHWRIDDLMAHREPVPDAENSAIIVAKVVAPFPAVWPNGDAEKGYNRLSAVPANVRLDETMANAFRNELHKHREAVRTARTVADYRRGRHEVELRETLIDTFPPETQSARIAARLLTMDAAIRVHEGDADGALDSCRAILGVGRSIGDEPFSVSQLVRVAMGNVAMLSARRVIGQGEPADSALAGLQSAIFAELDQPLLLYSMRGERATLTELIRRIGAGELSLSALSDQKSGPDGLRADMIPFGTLWLENQRAVALEWLNEAVAIARRPPVERAPLWASLQAEIDTVKESQVGQFTSLMPLFLAPSLPSFASSHSRHAANLGATAILIAAERHRQKTGDWPATIEAIDPSVLRTAPVDPHSGQPFRMERRDRQIVIYSVGPNLKDEHGAEDLRHRPGEGPDDVGAVGWDVASRRQAAELKLLPAKPQAGLD